MRMREVKLIMLCGLPGSGKSTYAQRLKSEKEERYEIVSSDAIRAKLYGDASCQGNPSLVFCEMRKTAIAFLNEGANVIYDATDIKRKHRVSLLAQLPPWVKPECHIVWAEPSECAGRDAARDRTVGYAVIDKMLRQFEAPFYDEGFIKIKVIFDSARDNIHSMNWALRLEHEMHIPHDNPHHTLDIYSHNRKAFELARENREDSNVLLACFWHDCGKPYVKQFRDTKGNPTDVAHYYGHQNVGAWLSYGIDEIASVDRVELAWLICCHMDPFINPKKVERLPKFWRDELMKVHKYDLEAH